MCIEFKKCINKVPTGMTHLEFNNVFGNYYAE